MDTSVGGGGGRGPYASQGLSSERMRACAGFMPTRVTFIGVDVPGARSGKAWPEGFSCAHLQAAATLRGWRGGCGHPQGPPATWVAATATSATT
ncbi:MAG TPA: hypothetical protein VFO60_05290 [Candidatus Dormibacteraeota bacterium]|nr:hypothetical protein [Candidatus Dormibacteraeota bacterium]